ncbi:unnamed protein product [Cuscuta epithymum]|uniref:Uncharacterized protein n=1 Tax=Cuscuta epithymum TaxID=186058 RepID=A0AAV0GAI1_9ASTE|nr:unnamed protein product [Cuscuta epithymum]
MYISKGKFHFMHVSMHEERKLVVEKSDPETSMMVGLVMDGDGVGRAPCSYGNSQHRRSRRDCHHRQGAAGQACFIKASKRQWMSFLTTTLHWKKIVGFAVAAREINADVA